MYCMHCGRNIKEEAAICPFCAGSVKEKVQEKVVEHSEEHTAVGIVFMLSFLIPTVGFALYFAWREYREKQAKASLIGGIINTIIIANLTAVLPGLFA